MTQHRADCIQGHGGKARKPDDGLGCQMKSKQTATLARSDLKRKKINRKSQILRPTARQAKQLSEKLLFSGARCFFPLEYQFWDQAG